MAKEMKEIDLIIIGSGPSGLAAAIYAGRANLSTLVLENQYIGGQVKTSYMIENYPGFNSISGEELAKKFEEHALSVGVEIEEFDTIKSVTFENNEKIVETEDYIYKPKAIIIATGASPKKLPIENEEKFAGKGIHYCAVCDGAMYKDSVIGVVGGGNSALEEALFLSNIAKKVYIIRRKDYFTGEKTSLEKVENNPKIEILYNFDLVNVEGDNLVKKAIIKNTKTLEVKEIELEAVFGYIGTEPKIELIKDKVETDDYGYIKVNRDMKTNIDGVYAIGDVTDKKYRQITTAVSDGTIAALEVAKYIEEMGK
ncbi:thioredoxin-disulfide reductase [Clostridium massiliamazoniense]|uniref:thioredoxin-disulfide reductase n=1 Tax=Clostridium massiliamazoniense TaxID=1347366 RepID=UPI0006D81084|nr:thioredoxin-disulfide reductase [Clostridium massiliamazoniense]